MGSVFIQVGQCGNQIGDQISQQFIKAESQLKGPVYCDRKGYLRMVCVDSESKVLAGLVDKKKGNFRPGNIISGRRGRGNNWALGYVGIGTEKVLETSLEAIRKEAERLPTLSCFVMSHSLCGGTGGGLGSRLLEEIRDFYPIPHIISCVVAPFSTGDTPLQHYNGLLSLASLQKFSDAVLLFKNDYVRQQTSSTEGKSSYEGMNKHIAATIGGIILPTDTLTPPSCYSIGLEPSEVIRAVCPQPSLKFLAASQKSHREATVPSLCNGVISSIKQESMSKKCHSLSNLVIVRGKQSSSCLAELSNIEAKMKKTLNSIAWNPFPLDVWTGPLYSGHRSWTQVTLVSNYSCMIPYGEQVWSNAKRMYQEKAYLHWYYKHGLSEEYFAEAFTTLEDTLYNYAEAIS